MPRATPNTESKICTAALRAAAKYGWSALTLDQIAAQAKISPAQVRKVFSDKNQILPALVRFIDKQSLPAGKSKAGTPHDRLFELLMARFDVLQKHREGLLAILKDSRRDPALLRLIAPVQWRSMQQVLSTSRLEPKGLGQPAAVLGLLGVYYRTLYAWQADKSPDMAKTMAALDQSLRCAAALAAIIFRDS